MNNYYEADNIDTLYKELIKNILTEPQYTPKPRGFNINEIIAPKIVLTNPLNCIITIPERKLNHYFAVIEKFEYLFGKHDPNRLIAYNKQFDSYKNNYNRFDGAYSERFNYWIEFIYELLKKDPDTRQAVISVYGQQDRHESKDIPCTLTHQYLIRDNKLHLIVNMRSNDILWGFPYDVNGFVFIQEVLASWLGIELGTYTHIAGSMHIYTDDPERLQTLLRCVDSVDTNNAKNPVFDLTYEQTKQFLPIFMAAEEALRKGNIALKNTLKNELPPCLSKYLQTLEYKYE